MGSCNFYPLCDAAWSVKNCSWSRLYGLKENWIAQRRSSLRKNRNSGKEHRKKMVIIYM